MCVIRLAVVGRLQSSGKHASRAKVRGTVAQENLASNNGKLFSIVLWDCDTIFTKLLQCIIYFFLKIKTTLRTGSRLMQSAWNLTNVHRRKSSNYCSNQSSCNILIFMFVEPSVREMNWFNRVIYTLKSAQHSFCSLYLTAIQLVNGQWLALRWPHTKQIYAEILIHFIPIDSP